MADPFIRGGNPDAPNLFPPLVIGKYSISVQADAAGYGCSPRERYRDIRRYKTVEVAVYGPDGALDAARAGYPPELRALFPPEGGSVARDVPLPSVGLIEEHLRDLDTRRAAVPSRPDPAAGPSKPIPLSDVALREILLKLGEAVAQGTGEVNDDFKAAAAELLEAARDRGIDLDGMQAIEGLGSDAPRP